MKPALSIKWLITVATILVGTEIASAQSISLEAGRVSGVTGQWTSVSVTQAFTTPIVTAGPLSFADVQPASVRVRTVSGSGFQVRAQEWDSQDGVHGAEQLSYVVMERGRYLLGNGKGVLADSTSVGGGGFQSKTFSQPFTTIPLIMATVVTQNEVDAVTVQIRNVTPTGFQIRLWEQEANSQAHAAETVHYLAWEPGVGTLNGFAFEVSSKSADHKFTPFPFTSSFPSPPLFFAGSQTTAGAEAYSLRYQGLGTESVQVRLQEDDSVDAEFFHVLETLGYLALTAGNGNQAPNGVIDTPTGNVAITAGQSVTFASSGSDPDNNLPLTYQWNFGASGVPSSTAEDPGTKVFSTPGTFTITFTVTDSLGLADPTPATRVITVNAAAGLIPLEAGRVSGVTGQWTSVSVTQAFTTPIVTAGPLSFADVQPAGVRVRTVSGSGFQVRAQEWDSQDGVHGAEQLSYVVMERGRYLLGNGKGVLADSTSVGGGGFQSKTFSQPFTTIPLIMATVVTQNEVDAVTVQIRNVSPTGFQIRLWEQEANSQAHAAETVHYLAWEPGVGTLNGFAFEVGTIGVNNVFATLWFGSPFADVPLLISGSQTTVGTEAYSIRQRNITRARVEMSLQEDDSFDAESSHATETVGYLLLGTPGPPGVGRDATLVAMGDSITFGIGDDITTDDYPVGILPPGGYPPILTRRVNDQLGKDILISNEGIPGDRSAEGAGDVDNLVDAYTQAQSFLLLYGANDAGFNVRSGVGLSPGQSGYLGSFKGNMQQIITSIRTAGKTPILAKVLYQTNPSKDLLIQQYNQVIEELASQNNLQTIPRPDFYTFFKNNPSLLPDGLHPNGSGYQSMATLWYNAISGLLQ